MSLIHKVNSFIASKLLKTLNSYGNNDAKNIDRQRRRMATEDTAQYVDQYLYQCATFKNRYDLLSFAIEQVKQEGLVLEFGVFSGKSINHTAERMPNAKIFGFDSFEGLPEDWRHDYKKGAFAVASLPKVKSNVTLIKGWFNEVLPDFVKQHPEKCALVHIDCDLYSSTKTIFDLLDQQLQPSVVLVFDEYFNYPGWRMGEFKALEEFCQRRKLKKEYLGYCSTDEQVAVRLVEELGVQEPGMPDEAFRVVRSQ